MFWDTVLRDLPFFNGIGISPVVSFDGARQQSSALGIPDLFQMAQMVVGLLKFTGHVYSPVLEYPAVESGAFHAAQPI